MLKSCDILATALGLLIGLTAPAAAEGTQPVTKDMEVADVTEVHPVSSFMQGEQPAISARSVQYDEKTGRFVMVLPYDGFRVSFTSLNPHKLIGVQYEDFHIDEAVYHKEIAPARTIAYEKEIQALREMGLGLGGSLENVIVYNDEGWLNPLHFEDELVRHKILDVIGDLRLAGIIRGHVIAAASGHALNTQLAKEIAAAYAGC